MLDLILTTKEGLVENMKLKSSLGCSDHEMVQLWIQGAARREHSQLITLTFGRGDFGLFRDLLDRVQRDKALEGKGSQESWWMFTSSKDRSDASQQSGCQAKMPGGWHG